MAYKTVTIAAGEHSWFPKGANILSITFNGEVEVESDCLDFSNVTGMQCWIIRSNFNDDNQRIYDQLTIGDQVYEFVDPLDPNKTIAQMISELLPAGINKTLGCTEVTESPNTGNWYVTLQLPSNLEAPELGFYDNDGAFGTDKNRGYLIADAYDSNCNECEEGYKNMNELID